MIAKFVRYGLKGLEEKAGEGYNNLRTKEIVHKIRILAKKFDLVLTRGSDYHGEVLIKATNRHQLGKYYCNKRVVVLLRREKHIALNHFC